MKKQSIVALIGLGLVVSAGSVHANQDDRPVVPDDFEVVEKTDSSLTLSWSESENADSYKVWQNNEKLIYEGESRTFTHENLSEDTSYNYYIRASNEAGDSINYRYNWGHTNEVDEEEESATEPVVTERPIVPNTFEVVSTSTDSLTLEWSASEGATSYKVLLDNQKVVYEGPKTSFTHKNAIQETSYNYYIYASNEAGDSLNYRYAWGYIYAEEESQQETNPDPEPELEITTGNNPISSVTDYRYYLDEGSTEVVKGMKQLDLVIVEPVVMQQEYITEAQEAGTTIYGYINSMEADKWNTALINQFDEEAFYHDENDERYYISKWDAYLMDISNEHYQDVLLDEIQRRIVDRGLNGVFLDTVGSIEDYHSGENMREQQAGMAVFMQRIKERFPNLSIAQNWGFDTLENYTAPYVDFIMWESFNASNIEEDGWYQDNIHLLKNIRSKYGVEVFTVSFEDETASAEIAKENGFKIMHNAEGSYYNTWID